MRVGVQRALRQYHERSIPQRRPGDTNGLTLGAYSQIQVGEIWAKLERLSPHSCRNYNYGIMDSLTSLTLTSLFHLWILRSDDHFALFKISKSFTWNYPKEECWKVSAKPRDRESLPTNDFWAALEKVWPGLHFEDKSFCIELERSTRDRSQHDYSIIICMYHRDSDPRRVPLLFPENLRDLNFRTRIYPPICTARVRYARICD